jgi:hypothetical protein
MSCRSPLTGLLLLAAAGLLPIITRTQSPVDTLSPNAAAVGPAVLTKGAYQRVGALSPLAWQLHNCPALLRSAIPPSPWTHARNLSP